MFGQIFEALLATPITLALTMLFGFFFLLLGADGLVDGASGIAKRFGVNSLVIGMTVVAFGTSMPEFVVNMVSVTDDATDLAVTNILGSNIINTLVILGCSALVFPIAVQRNTLRFDIPMNILAGASVLFFVLITFPFDADNGLSRVEGIFLLIVFVAFLVYGFRTAKDDTDTVLETVMPTWKGILYILFGLVGLVIGGEMIVKSATTIAQSVGVSESVIGLTIVALGTSLPELATSVVAAFKRNSDIAVGNVVGSNIFNVFFILGTSAVIRPLPVYDGIVLDAAVTAFSAFVVLLLALCNKRAIPRWGGAVLLTVYAAYLMYRLINC